MRTNRIVEILDETTTYPYTSKANIYGVAVINRGNDDVIISVGGVTITVKPEETFDAEFHPFKIVNVTAGSSFNIALKG